MTPRKIALSITPLALLVTLVLAACGGGGDGATETRVGTGQLTDPRNVATATPWPERKVLKSVLKDIRKHSDSLQESE